MRRGALAIAVVMLASLPMAAVQGSSAAPSHGERRYLVLLRAGADPVAAERELERLGARTVTVNDRVGLSTVVSGDPAFAENVMRSGLFVGASPDRPVGALPRETAPWNVFDRPLRPRATRHRPAFGAATTEPGDPLLGRQWYLRTVGAGPNGSYAFEKGDPRVLVGVIDSGIERRHLDMRNVSKTLSKSFIRDIPEIDGRCRDERDRSCLDSPLTDPVGHGTSVASILAARTNGFGMSGVAPEVKLVSLRVVQEAGLIFLQPAVDAITYAADNGIDVVNMSFTVDPWFFNCPDNPADTAEAQQEQRTIVEAMDRAVAYARERSVTLIAAVGNSHVDLDNPTVDEQSPLYPYPRSYTREIDDSCLLVPAELDGVLGVSAIGPSGRKAYYSNYGFDAVEVAAPGGDDLDPAMAFPRNLMLAAVSVESAREYGAIDRNGRPTTPFVLRRCRADGRCAYYAWGAGTSAAAPLAAGVAALIVSVSGTDDGAGGLTMDPAEVERILLETATSRDCPEGGVQEYPEAGDGGEELTAACTARGSVTSFFGSGVVSALRAVTPQ